jgi:hypothetical protein
MLFDGGCIFLKCWGRFLAGITFILSFPIALIEGWRARRWEPMVWF